FFDAILHRLPVRRLDALLERVEFGNGQMSTLAANRSRRKRLDLGDRRIRQCEGGTADESVQAETFFFDLCLESAVADEQSLGLGENEMATVAAEAGQGW